MNNFKTKNNNYRIFDRGYYRFIDSTGTHLRWVDDQEVEYLVRVLEYVSDIPKIQSRPAMPSIERYWQYVEPAEFPELSNNGGSYDHLTCIEKWSGWGKADGFYLTTNHLYNSDFEEQGWHSVSLKDEKDAQAFIIKFANKENTNEN